MRSPFLSLLLLLFAAFSTSGSAQTDSGSAQTDNVVQDVQSAASRATDQLNEKSKEIDKKLQKAAPDVQDKINAIQASIGNLVPGKVTIIPVEAREALTDEVKSFIAYAEKKERLYSMLSLISICLSSGLALVGGIASFMSKNRLAGIISLIVAAVVGLSNAYPIRPLAEFYADAKSQAKAIVANSMLSEPYTETLYVADITQYKLLLLYERDRPSIGKYDNPTDALQQEAKSVSIAAKNADTANAVSNEIVGFTR